MVHVPRRNHQHGCNDGAGEDLFEQSIQTNPTFIMARSQVPLHEMLVTFRQDGSSELLE